MGKFYESIPPELIPWLRKQEQFWVATAPLSAEGHVNVSPKGVRDSFHVLSPTRVWYQDLTGSGVETISHLRENGRVTLMFSAFEGPPRIVRLFGTGTVHEFGTPEYDALIPPEKRRPSSRSAIVVDVHKVGTSCGYAVNYYYLRTLALKVRPKERRNTLNENKSKAGAYYRTTLNEWNAAARGVSKPTTGSYGFDASSTDWGSFDEDAEGSKTQYSQENTERTQEDAGRRRERRRRRRDAGGGRRMSLFAMLSSRNRCACFALEKKPCSSTHLDYGEKLEKADRAAGGRSDKGIKAYWANTNARSIDGLPGLAHAHTAERVPDSREAMKRADASEGDEEERRDGGEAAKTKASGGVLVKRASSIERRRVEEWAVAFALGLAVAAIYVQVADLVPRSLISSSRLPIELCETIIDAIRPSCAAWYDDPRESPTLKACALTCRAWRPRAQLNLWKAVLLQHRERVMPEFVAAARGSPDRLAPLVRTMCLHPFGERVPLDVFMLGLPNLHMLVLEAVMWTPFPPRASRMRMPLLASVRELALSRCGFHTVKDMLDVVWSCPNLSRVVILNCSFTRERLTEAESARLSTLRKRPGACEKLTSLRLFGHPFEHLSAPSGSVFGSAVTDLDISYTDLAFSSTALPRLLASFPHLQTLSLTGFILDADSWKAGPGLIPSVAAALPSPRALRTMTVHVEMSYETDDRTIDALCRREAPQDATTTEDAPAPAPNLRALLRGLTRLEVRLAGVPFESEDWWSAQIVKRLSSMREVLYFSVVKINKNIVVANSSIYTTVLRKAKDGSVIILQLPLRISEENEVDLSLIATPERFRLVDCASLSDDANPALCIHECDTFESARDVYCAISYIWKGNPPRESRSASGNPPTKGGTIVVEHARDGDPVGLDVLRHACLAIWNGRPRVKYLWLDRLCMMQGNRSDKAWQIRKMFDVYKQCALCLVLPGGVGRLVGLDEETEWVFRAWTLQEAVVPPVTEVLFSIEDLPVPAETTMGVLLTDRSHSYGRCNLKYVVPGSSATAELRTLLRAIRVPSTDPRVEFHPTGISIPLTARIFGSPETRRRELLALADAADTIWNGNNWSRQALWQSSFLRTSKRPVDMVLSIMGLFGISLDPLRYRSGDRVAATIALAQEYLRGGGQAEWLIAGWNEPPDRRLSSFPELPETSVAAPPRFAAAKRDVSCEVDRASLDIRFRFSSQQAPSGRMDDSEGYFYFTTKTARTHRSASGIYRLPFNLVLKTTSYANTDATTNEAHALRTIESVSGVNAPHLVDWASDKRTSYTLMTWVDGDCCNDVWEKLTPSDKDRIAHELRSQLGCLRQQTVNRRSVICAASGAPVYDPRVPWLQDDPQILHSSREFFEKVWLGLDLPRNRDTICPAIRPLIDRQDVPVVFCHGDLLPKNLILPGGLEKWRRGSTQLYLIDWEYAGWMPLPWEALKATWLVVDPDEDEWYRLMRQVFTESSEELDADWLWRLRSGITIL
ncbi:hypothetical protein OH77DRAFT_1512833 [Trametes cingulata]|nr:hypothetical protein OH77DRAFT_1512833 [Trametes cingulata]